MDIIWRYFKVRQIFVCAAWFRCLVCAYMYLTHAWGVAETCVSIFFDLKATNRDGVPSIKSYNCNLTQKEKVYPRVATVR